MRGAPKPGPISGFSQLRVDFSNRSLSPLPSPNGAPLSPIGDESVQGYLTDVKPSYNGAKEIVLLIEAIEAKEFPCCIVGEAALIYYGAKRVMSDWLICVRTDHLDQVVEIVKSSPDRYESFRPSMLNVYGSLKPRYPRFKLVGMATFFVVMSSQACHLDVRPKSVEHDRWIHLPYPKLSHYAQALLEIWNLTDLEDLIDGMNLSIEWGEEHLNLDGTVDQNWACWRETVLAERELTDDDMPKWAEPKRRIWNKLASTEAKKKRQGWKSRPEQITRFWTAGQQDPRDKPKDYS